MPHIRGQERGGLGDWGLAGAWVPEAQHFTGLRGPGKVLGLLMGRLPPHCIISHPSLSLYLLTAKFSLE